MKKGVSDAEALLQAPIGSTEDTDKGTEPMCQEAEEDTVADEGCQALECESADQARGSSSSKSEDKVSELEALIRRIIRKGKRPTGEREASKVDAEDQSHSPFKPHEQSGMMPGNLIRVVGSLYSLRSYPRK